MPHPTDNADPQPSKKGFFASLFARHKAPVSSSKQTARQPQRAQPIPEPQPQPKHSLQHEIDPLLARLSQTLGNARLHSFGSKERDVLEHQYGQALRAYRRGGSEKDQETITLVLNEILTRLRALLKALDERTRRIAPTASEPIGAYGFAAKNLGDAYAGETLARGWREVEVSPEGPIRHQIWELLRNTAIDKITEGEWDQRKRNLHELRIAEDGHAYTRDAVSHEGYVVDSDGKTYMFSGEVSKRELTEAERAKIDDNLRKIEPLKNALRERFAGVTEEDLEVARHLRKLRKLASDAQLQPADKATSDKLHEELAACEQRVKELSDAKRIDVFEAALEWDYLQIAKRRLERAKSSKQVELATHHSSPTGGKSVAGAGTLKQDTDGKIVEISNVSGHYKPMFVHLAQTIEHLMRQGALLDKTLVYHDQQGNKRRIDEDPELKALYQRVITKLPELEQLSKETRAVINRLDALPQQLNEEQRKVEQVTLERKKSECLARLEPIEKAVHVLRKLGAGPANKASEARVVFIDNIQDKAGLQIHEEAINVIDKPTVEEFLTSGGGHRVYAKAKVEEKGGYTSKTVAQAKSEMLNQLKTVIAKGVEKKEETDKNNATDGAEKKKKAGMNNKVLETLKEKTEKFHEEAERLPDALKKAMGDKAFAELIDANKAPTSDDIKRALNELQPQDMHERTNASGPSHRHGNPPGSNFGQGYRWSEPSAPIANNTEPGATHNTRTENPEQGRERDSSGLRRNVPAPELGEGYQNDETSEGIQPGDSAPTGYEPLELDESGMVAAQTGEDREQGLERKGSGLRRKMAVPELGEGYQNQETSEGAQPGDGVMNGYTKLKLDENVEKAEASVTSRLVTGQGYVVNHGYVDTIGSHLHNKREAETTQRNTGYVGIPRDSDSPSKQTKLEDKGFERPKDYIKQVEQKYKRKVQSISGQGLNCYIRSILTGVRNSGWHPQPPQTLESVINEIAGVLRAEGLRAPDGLVDAGGRDGARVRQVVNEKTGYVIGLRIVTWDRTNARITAFDVTTGSLTITLVHTPGHFDLLS